MGISVRTLHHWEQGKHHSSGAAQSLLRIATLNSAVVLVNGGVDYEKANKLEALIQWWAMIGDEFLNPFGRDQKALARIDWGYALTTGQGIL